MVNYVIRRLVAFVPTLLAVVVLVFLLIDLVPGDPVVLILGWEAPGESIEELRRELGLDQPWYVRMFSWLRGITRGDFGESLFLDQSMGRLIAKRFPVTLSIATVALIIAVGVGVTGGIIAAVYQGTLADWAAMVVALFVLSVPSFWLALNLIYLFAVELRWLPVGGYVPLSEGVVPFLRHLFLPSVSLGLAYAAIIARITRTAMLEVLRMDYIRTARAKGLRELAVIGKHAFRNSLIPVVTVVGIAVGGLLGGSAVTETVYNLPGMGRLIVEAVRRRDYPVVQGGILVLTVGYLVINLVVDVIYALVNPRIRYE